MTVSFKPPLSLLLCSVFFISLFLRSLLPSVFYPFNPFLFPFSPLLLLCLSLVLYRWKHCLNVLFWGISCCILFFPCAHYQWVCGNQTDRRTDLKPPTCRPMGFSCDIFKALARTLGYDSIPRFYLV